MDDVIVIGGGVIGCATAAFLRHFDRAIAVTVVEPDPGYRAAASLQASGGVRQLFSCVENIQMSAFTAQVIQTWQDFLTDAGPIPELAWRQQGYLLFADKARAETLARNLETQRAAGVAVEWLEPDAIAERFPLIHTTDLGGGVLSPQDGWLDPDAFLQGLRLKAESLGTAFVTDRVTGFEVSGHAVRAIILESGRRLEGKAFVNAAGRWAPGLAAQVGMPVPIRSMLRFDHYAETQVDAGSLPFIKDPDHLAVRPEGAGILAGVVMWKPDQGRYGTPAARNAYFNDIVWPALAHRIPAFDQLKLRSSFSGHYDTNDLDGNMIIGSHAGRVENFYLACGFSGHGLMHAPAVGRALSELILYGEYKTLDLSRMHYQRVVDNRPYAERGVI